jgi:hypothetical protein
VVDCLGVEEDFPAGAAELAEDAECALRAGVGSGIVRGLMFYYTEWDKKLEFASHGSLGVSHFIIRLRFRVQ